MSGPAPPALIYLDSAAASWSKPPPVIDAMRDFLTEIGASSGRSVHR